MSRRAPNGATKQVVELQKELSQLKAAALAANVEATSQVDGVSSESVEAAPSFDALSGTEKAAASLGVHPDSWRPIGFMNNAHYHNLMKNNALDNTLARRISAFRVVASS